MPDDYSNPAPPEDIGYASGVHAEQLHPLKNDDFRKFLMTPRVSTGDKPQASTAHSFTHKGGHGDSKKKGAAPKQSHGHRPKHVRPKKEDEDDLLEIMKNYRDRAKERREGETTEQTKEIDLLQATAGYRAMAPDIKSTFDAAQRRKQMIEESKYLGGDMEHTHLVKGLDYALLQKVRSEIVSKEKEDELDALYVARKTERDKVEGQIKSPLAKNIYSLLFKSEPAKVSELFAPRRMAYVVELDDEYADTDIPTTLIRSKAECPVDEASSNLSINDIVIQKLTQVLAYLRTDSKKKKKGKGKDKIDEATRAQVASQNIYDTTGEYVPNLKKSADVKRAKKDGTYFDRPVQDDGKSKSDKDRDRKGRDRERDRDRDTGRHGDKERDWKSGSDNRQSRGLAQNDRLNEALRAAGVSLPDDDKAKSSAKLDYDPLRKQAPETEGDVRMCGEPVTYAECYPGGFECYDAADDSDDEVDYSKMDLGNRKGPIRRWDFDTEQEYEDYMSRREALPKAAFQYGVKMNDGRKTRKVGTGKTEADQKAKHDRQWNQISKILAKRQGDGDGSESAYKKPKY